MKNYYVARPENYKELVSKLRSRDQEAVIIIQTGTKISHSLLNFIQDPFEAFEHKFTGYSKSGQQQSLTLGAKRPYKLEINGLPIQGGPYQLLIKK